MSVIRTIPWDHPHDERTCYAQWKEGIDCPNEATWCIQNVDNDGYAQMCWVHCAQFKRDYPYARVGYIELKGSLRDST